jgi:hypothetical protein
VGNSRSSVPRSAGGCADAVRASRRLSTIRRRTAATTDAPPVPNRTRIGYSSVNSHLHNNSCAGGGHYPGYYAALDGVPQGLTLDHDNPVHGRGKFCDIPRPLAV